jgi:hypothetical protein
MVTPKIYIRSKGVTLTLDTGIDISSATLCQINFKKPTGETGNWNGRVIGTTKITCVMDDEDLDSPGTWKFQAYVEMGDSELYGETVEQQICDLFE